MGAIVGGLMDIAHGVDDFLSSQADGGDALQQINHLFLVSAEPVDIEPGAEGRVFRLALLVLVENPFQRRAVAKPVLPDFGRYAEQRGLRVQHDPAVTRVGLEQCLGRVAGIRLVKPLEWIRFNRCVADVQIH